MAVSALQQWDSATLESTLHDRGLAVLTAVIQRFGCAGPLFLPGLTGFPSPPSRGGNPVCLVKIFLPLRRSCACFVFFLREAL